MSDEKQIQPKPVVEPSSKTSFISSPKFLWGVLGFLAIVLVISIFLLKKQKTDFTTTTEGKLELVQEQSLSIYRLIDKDNKVSYEMHIGVENSKTVKLPIVFRRNGIDSNLSEKEKMIAIDTWLKSRAIDNASFAEFPPPEKNSGPYMPLNIISNEVKK